MLKVLEFHAFQQIWTCGVSCRLAANCSDSRVVQSQPHQLDSRNLILRGSFQLSKSRLTKRTSIATGAEKHILPNVPDLNKNKLLPISSNGFSYVNAVWLLQTIFFLLSPAPLHLPPPCSIIAKKLHNPKNVLHYILLNKPQAAR